ncbi:hypothetical protein F1529_00285 [Alcanivorax sp. VBW004]|uniref:hypothetical protein n=1 Tax=Alcanivorax sp. VBW004 TaxID=1287708 RepID=UPI0012BC2C1D|nr:hypothetical protein [Alcanivorax sp. VBW004]MTT50908.1 hypothetical protein [Alcanivorax sp. VBW004]
MKLSKVFLLLLPAIFSGCTNVAGDVTRTLSPVSSAPLDRAALFSSANAFFTDAGYQCRSTSDTEDFRCRKDLRDIYIHQTHAVVEIFPGDDGGNPLLVTTRWDEGLIPGEFISSQFSNPDVAAFCDYLAQATLAVCRNAS